MFPFGNVTSSWMSLLLRAELVFQQSAQQVFHGADIQATFSPRCVGIVESLIVGILVIDDLISDGWLAS